MPVAKIRENFAPAAPVEAQPRTASARPAGTPGMSPALALQEQLAQRAAGMEAPVQGQWSPRQSLALIVSVSAALWFALLMFGAETAKLIA